jgi:hypothetical protein
MFSLPFYLLLNNVKNRLSVATHETATFEARAKIFFIAACHFVAVVTLGFVIE